MFDVIKNLKCALNSDFRNSCSNWFRIWWKANCLHKIKIKFIAIIKYMTTQKHDVVSWFHDYRHALQSLRIIDRKNIINFDETKFQIKCIKKHNIFIFVNVKDFYSFNSENKKSMIVIEIMKGRSSFSSRVLIFKMLIELPLF